jgi:hypothetical protein
MYKDFFGLTEAPFGITPDTDFFYAYRSHHSAMPVFGTLSKIVYNSWDTDPG